MRDFRDAKAMAHTLRAAVAAKGLKITISESLELIAKAFGATDWNTLSAAIKAAEAEPAAPQPSAPPRTGGGQPGPSVPGIAAEPSGRAGFAAAFQATLRRAVDLAARQNHERTTLEHLLLALVDDPDAAEVLRACDVDLAELRASLATLLDEPATPNAVGGESPPPTSNFQRVCQRAVIHVQNSGQDQITGANALVAIFSERESRAARLLAEQKLTRHDAVEFIMQGTRKDGLAWLRHSR